MKKALFAACAVMLCATALLVYRAYDTEEAPRGGLVLDGSTANAPSAVGAGRDLPKLPTVAPSAATPLPPVPAMRSNNRLVIGRISTNVRKHWPRLDAMASYLAAELAPFGVAGVEVKMVDTMEEMREMLRAGEIDLFSETAFAAIELTQDGSAEMLLREWKSGVSDYHTVIFARRDSGIDSLDDLVGRTMSFEDRGSTSGYLVPRANMAQHGLSLAELNDGLARPPIGTVGFNFADDEGTVVSRVLRGFSDAGAMSNLDWADEDEVTEVEKRELIVVHETDPVIRSILLVRSTLDSNIKGRLASVLERMHETEAGLDTLKEYWKVAKFDRIEGAALDSLLNARIFHETSRGF